VSRGVGPFLLAVPVGQPPVVGLPEYSEVATHQLQGCPFADQVVTFLRITLHLQDDGARRSRSRSTTFDLGQVLDPAIVFRFLHPFA